MKTVRDLLTAFARENVVDPSELIQMQMRECLINLSPRYRRLATEVILRLPAEWDSHAVWEMREEERYGEIDSVVDRLYAGSRLKPEEESTLESLQSWEVVISPSRLNALSDVAVSWIIVHELAHVASALPTDPKIRLDDISEDRADNIALWWGFKKEREAFDAENKPGN